jgi:hypothetical protein
VGSIEKLGKSRQHPAGGIHHSTGHAARSQLQNSKGNLSKCSLYAIKYFLGHYGGAACCIQPQVDRLRLFGILGNA